MASLNQSSFNHPSFTLPPTAMEEAYPPCRYNMDTLWVFAWSAQRSALEVVKAFLKAGFGECADHTTEHPMYDIQTSPLYDLIKVRFANPHDAMMLYDVGYRYGAEVIVFTGYHEDMVLDDIFPKCIFVHRLGYRGREANSGTVSQPGGGGHGGTGMALETGEHSINGIAEDPGELLTLRIIGLPRRYRNYATFSHLVDDLGGTLVEVLPRPNNVSDAIRVRLLDRAQVPPYYDVPVPSHRTDDGVCTVGICVDDSASRVMPSLDELD